MSLVRFNLEFVPLIWSCNYSKYKIDLYNVQYKFLKITVFVFGSHITRYAINVGENDLRMNSLSTRRKLADIMLVYYILSNLIIDSPQL